MMTKATTTTCIARSDRAKIRADIASAAPGSFHKTCLPTHSALPLCPMTTLQAEPPNLIQQYADCGMDAPWPCRVAVTNMTTPTGVLVSIPVLEPLHDVEINMENHVARLDDLFKQVGVASDLLAIDVYPDEAMWHVAIDEESVFAKLDETLDVLVLSTNLGSPPQENTAKVYALAARCNFIWPEGDGVRLGLDGEGGSLWLLMDVAADALDSEQLGGVILRFGEMARKWREIVTTDHDTLAGQSLEGDAMCVSENSAQGTAS